MASDVVKIPQRAPHNPNGARPLKFTLAKLTELGDKYFAETPQEQWTITGLALALDTSRETLMEYSQRDEFVDTIKKYKLMVHNAYELALRARGSSADIFALKNFGWRDTQDIRSEVALDVKPAQDVTQDFAQFVKAKTEAIDGEATEVNP